MSGENVETSYRAFDMFHWHDLEGFLALMAEDVSVDSRLVLMEGGFRGHDGVRRWWKNLFGEIPDYTVEVVEVRDLGDDLTLAHLHNRGHGTTSATPFEETTWMPARWRRGRCAWWAVFLSEEEALEAAGLRE